MKQLSELPWPIYRYHLSEGERLLAQEDYLAGSGQLWDAVADLLKAAARRRDWRCETPRDLRVVESRLFEETGDEELSTLCAVAESLHAGYEERYACGSWVRSYAEPVRKLVAKLEPLAGREDSEGDAMPGHEKLLALHEHYLREAQRLLTAGDRVQTSEKLWGAAATLVKAVAELRGWEHHRHHHLRQAVDKLFRETGDRDLLRLFSVAESLHANFYEDFASPEALVPMADDVYHLVGRLRPLADGPATS